MNQNDPKETIASKAGVGGVAVLGAKVFFILSGLVQQALLPRFIGRAGYGALSLVLAPANIVNNVVVAGSTQSASRAVASAPGNERAAQRAAMRVHVPLAIGAGALFAGAAWPISQFEHAPHIVAPLLAMSAVVLFYGLYAPLIGVLNGRGLFVKQASLDVIFATMRTAGLLGLGWLFVRRGLSGSLGSAVGFSSAALVIAIIAASFVGRLGQGRGTGGSVLEGRAYLAVLVPLALAQLFTNALMQLDIMLLGRFLAEGAHGSGLTGAGAERSTDEWVGAYRACQLFAFLPYQLLLSLTQVLFPMLARAKVESPEAVRAYVLRGARLGAIATGLMVAVIAGMPETAIRFAYDVDTASRGASALRVLALAQGGFAMLGIGCTVLSSLGRERVSAALTATAAVVAAGACTLVVPHRAFGGDQLVATAWCMAGTLAVALIACTALVVRIAGAFVPVATSVRVLVALGVTLFVGARLPAASRLLAPFTAVGLACIFVIALVALREVGRDDAAWAAKALRRR